MRFLQLLFGIMAVCLAPFLVIPAVFHARCLLKGTQDDFSLHIGHATITGWAFIGLEGGAGLLIGVGGFYVFFPREGRR